MKRPNRPITPTYYAAIIVFFQLLVPQAQAFASSGLAAPASPALPFNDPTWKALVGLALLVNIFLYILVWRRRVN